jgi:hypothetical protein
VPVVEAHLQCGLEGVPSHDARGLRVEVKILNVQERQLRSPKPVSTGSMSTAASRSHPKQAPSVVTICGAVGLRGVRRERTFSEARNLFVPAIIPGALLVALGDLKTWD